MRFNCKNIPNSLTMCRLLLAIPAYILSVHGAWLAGGVILVIILITDLLDGALARKWKCVTAMGHTLDAIADFACIAAYGFGASFAGAFQWQSEVILIIGTIAWIEIMIRNIRVDKAHALPHLTAAKVVVSGLVLTYILIIFGRPERDFVLSTVLLGPGWWTYRSYLHAARDTAKKGSSAESVGGIDLLRHPELTIRAESLEAGRVRVAE